MKNLNRIINNLFTQNTLVIMIRFSFLLVLSLMLGIICYSQSAPTEPDKSPLDISYSPNAYPVLKFQNKKFDTKVNARVLYSRPQVKGRDIFGGELKYGELWRLGANESTEIELYKPAVIGGKKIPKGRYTMYCIPQENKWTIIINKDTDSWGGFSYRQEMDLVRTTVPVSKIDTPVEYLTIYFETPTSLVMMWENVKVNLPVQFVNQ
jgi:hypothetical protein